MVIVRVALSQWYLLVTFLAYGGPSVQRIPCVICVDWSESIILYRAD